MQLEPNPNNPRTISKDAFETLKKKIQRNPDGLSANKIVHKDGIIIAGNQRWRALQDLGLELKDEWFKDVSNWTPEQIREYLITSNISDGEWDWDILANEWEKEELEELGLETPWNDPEEVVEDEAPEVSQEEPKSKLGEIYQLGRHRIMCGDSTDKANLELLMDGNKADIAYTDPPYGMSLDVDYDSMFKNDKNHKTKGNRFDSVIDDDKYFDPTVILGILADIQEVFLWGADYFYDSLPRGGSLSAWDKRTENLDKVVGNTTEFLWSKQPHRRMTARVLWSGHHGMGSADEKSRVHPTQKPIKLHEWFFENYGNKSKTVLDLFLGSGSTLIACEQTDRICYGMELDPKYVDVIRKRYAKYCYPDTWEERWEELTPEVKDE